MKKYIIKHILLILIITGCSKDDNSSNTINDSPKLELTLINSNSYSANFKFDFSYELENVRLIWSDLIEVSLRNKIGELEVNQNISYLSVNNLKESKTYYFKLVGTQNGQNLYSDEITVATSEIEILFNAQIASSITTSYIEEVVKLDDGYLIVSGYGEIFINKLDNNFNLLWSTEIDERDTNFFKSIIDLENGDFIVFCSGNIGYDRKSFAVKIDNSGNKLWTKYYNYANNSDYWFNEILRFKNNGSEIKLLTAVDTTSYNDRLDTFYHQYTINTNGDVIKQESLPYEFNTFLNIKYDSEGNFYNYGTIDLTPDNFVTSFDGVLEKYDVNNNLIWHKHYNDELFGDARLDEMLLFKNNIINIGVQVDQYGAGTNKNEYRLVQFRDNQGNLLWEFTETSDAFLYQGKDISNDFDNNLLVLFFDIFYPNSPLFNIATLMKFDLEGNLIWKYEDGESFNTDRFTPSKIFTNTKGEYLIFGVKDANKLWLKKIKIE